MKIVAENNKAFIVSPEVFEVLNELLNELMRSEENTTRDVQILSRPYSGESSFYRFATEKTREIPPNVRFFILGSTRVPYAAGLLDLSGPWFAGPLYISISNMPAPNYH